MTSVNKALAEIARMVGNDDANEIGNCMYRFKICDELLASVKREQDLNKKKNILKILFNEIKECVSRKSFSSLMRNKMSSLMKDFNDAVDVHNKNVDYARLEENGEQSTGGTRRRNKKSKNYKKKSRKSSRTKKSRRH